VSQGILVQVAALPSAVEVWRHIETSFASQSHVRVINTRMSLATTQKGSSTVAEYIAKMKALADDMASIGKKLDDEELSSYILAGLDSAYNGVMSSIATQVEPITIGELYAQLLAFENHLDLQNGGQQHLQSSQTSVNNAMRGRGTPFRGRGGRGSCTRGGNNGGGRGRGGARNKFPPCQLCGRTNHPVFKCYKRFDPTYTGEEKSANTASSYGVDSNWYADSSATDHVTGELNKLAVTDTNNRGEQTYTASGSGMHIKHVGHAIIHTPLHDLKLNHALHVP
jgi:hypothetical protein